MNRRSAPKRLSTAFVTVKSEPESSDADMDQEEDFDVSSPQFTPEDAVSMLEVKMDQRRWILTFSF